MKGDGPVAKGLRQTLKDAQDAEARAKEALDQARIQGATQLSVSQDLVNAYNVAKGAYEAKQKALIEAGPGLLNTFWWLTGMLHTQPLLIVFIFVWAAGEASSVISHASAGDNAYERARYTTIQEDIRMRREAYRTLRARHEDEATHRAEMLATSKAGKRLMLDVKDRTKD